MFSRLRHCRHFGLHHNFTKNILQKRKVVNQLFGQVFSDTHPHVLKENEAIVGFTLSELQMRRQKLLEILPNECIMIVPSAEKSIMTNDIPYSYRQNSDFYYLTGFMEPSACLIIEKHKTHGAKFSLFTMPKNAFRELWNGPCTGMKKAKDELGIDTYSIDEFKTEIFRSIVKFSEEDTKVQRIPIIFDKNVNKKIFEDILEIFHWNKQNAQHFKFEPPSSILNGMRMIKSSAEINTLRKAAQITGDAFISAMQCTCPGLSESHIEGIMEFEVRLRGAQRLAYPPVVSSGERCNVTHYVINNQVLKDGDLILVDAGAEYYLYSVDITRVWPVNGKFSKAQRDIYGTVLDVQKKVISDCKVGVSLKQLHKNSMKYFAEELTRLGFPIKSESEIEYLYGHAVGHPMGMDIHEQLPLFDQSLEEGMIVTIEPGLHIPSKQTIETADYYDSRQREFLLSIPEQYLGIGIMIEDDVVICDQKKTGHDYDVLSKSVPKEIEHIEQIMADRSSNPLSQYTSRRYSF